MQGDEITPFANDGSYYPVEYVGRKECYDNTYYYK